MILVITKVGTHFVNENITQKVCHDKEHTKVWITRLDGSLDAIENVETVIYANDAQAVHWQDDGTIVEELKDKMQDLENEVVRLKSKLRDFGCEL